MRSLTNCILAVTCSVIVLFLFIGPEKVHAQDKPSREKVVETEQNIDKGRVIYFKRCSFCHGLLGDGNGPAADYMDPRPRDFTLGIFKFRTTESGELPLDEDLFRTISRGLFGTGMQGFDDELIANGLTEEERWQVIYFIKTFAPEFSNALFDPSDKVIPLPDNRAPYNADSIGRGKEIFIRAKCWECHGSTGKGDGLKSFGKIDDWGYPVRVRNITEPWKIKGGAHVEDIYFRLSTGLSGSPMPSYLKALTGDERWLLANFIKSMQREPTKHRVLKAKRIKGALPIEPGSSEWEDVAPMDVRMTGQVIAAPRWQNPSVEMVTVRAIYNQKEIAFLLEWDDPFRDTIHEDSKELNLKETNSSQHESSYIKAKGMIPRKVNIFRDALALQLPVDMTASTRKPHFFRGDADKPVNLWVWWSDREARGERAVKAAVARGYEREITVKDEEGQNIMSRSVWEEGRYSLVMKRSLKRSDRNDIQFDEGEFIPIALNVWDGSNGDHGLIMSLSSWYYLLLEKETPVYVYIYSLLGIAVAVLGEIWLVRKLSRV